MLCLKFALQLASHMLLLQSMMVLHVMAVDLLTNPNTALHCMTRSVLYKGLLTVHCHQMQGSMQQPDATTT